MAAGEWDICRGLPSLLHAGAWCGIAYMLLSSRAVWLSIHLQDSLLQRLHWPLWWYAGVFQYYWLLEKDGWLLYREAGFDEE